MSRLRARQLSLIPALTVLAAALPQSTGAEGSPSVRILAASLAPAQASVAEGRPFVLANRSGSLARIEFSLERGERLPCATGGQPETRARKFLVEAGAELVCRGEAGRYDYTVFQNVRRDSGEFVHRREEGRIDVR